MVFKTPPDEADDGRENTLLRIMIITALFPPAVIGGAEVSAANFATRIARRGHDVTVLSTTTKSSEKNVIFETFEDTVRVRREPMPRTYPAYDFANHSAFAKLVWHGQDHLDPRNQSIWANALDEMKPELAVVHVTQGLGYNGLIEIGKRDIPTIFVMHDLSLACYKTSMFVNGRTCNGPCKLCSLSSKLKYQYLSRIPRIGFVSPSRSNYQTVACHVPIGRWPHRIILNPNQYPGPTSPRIESPTLRLMYAGQISKSKGVEFLLKVVDGLSGERDISLRVVGGGPELERLKGEYAGRPNITFTGKVQEAMVSTFMAESDLLCTPSLWPDNSPGVIIQAMSCGLPVLGSDKGGIPELITHDVTGAIVEAGNDEAWRKTIADMCDDRSRVRRWSADTLEASKRFDPEASIDAYLDFAKVVMLQPPSVEAPSA